jgi:hypothetical protein
MDPSMGLKNIRLQRISHSEGDIVISILNRFRRPGRKREKSNASWERNRLDRMEMDPWALFIPVLCIDMDFMTLVDQSGKQVNQVSFGPPPLFREVPKTYGKPYFFHIYNE